MAKSIAQRVRRSFLAVSLFSLLVIVLAVWFAYEDLEEAMLRVDIREEEQFLVAHSSGREVQRWETANLIAVHLPEHLADPAAIPALFAGLPFPYTGEIERQGRSYLVKIAQTGSGRLYLARDTTKFEERERLFTNALAVLSVLMVALGYLLARTASRRLVDPLKRLTRQIGGIAPGQKMERVDTHYREAELGEIAQSFNRFLDELETYVKREQSLLSLASHELRTPVAVISGALDVIEQRGGLGADDRKTVDRIRRATAEMRSNIDALLKLTRRNEADTGPAIAIAPMQLLEELREELEQSGLHARQRIVLPENWPDDEPVVADRALVKMLLRNLLQNALQHTPGAIVVSRQPGCLRISDQGSGLPPDRLMQLRSAAGADDTPPLSGLGLFIVTLACERLGWRIAADTSGGGTTLNLWYCLAE